MGEDVGEDVDETAGEEIMRDIGIASTGALIDAPHEILGKGVSSTENSSPTRLSVFSLPQVGFWCFPLRHNHNQQCGGHGQVYSALRVENGKMFQKPLE